MTTLELGRIKTCRLPRFSALYIVFRASPSTLIRTILASLRAELWPPATAKLVQPSQASSGGVSSSEWDASVDGLTRGLASEPICWTIKKPAARRSAGYKLYLMRIKVA